MYKFLEKIGKPTRHIKSRCRKALGLSANYVISAGAESAGHPEGGARCR